MKTKDGAGARMHPVAALAAAAFALSACAQVSGGMERAMVPAHAAGEGLLVGSPARSTAEPAGGHQGAHDHGTHGHSRGGPSR